MNKKYINIIVGILLLTLLIVSYSYHFDNPFFFDDYHSIVNNTYIHSLDNALLFFHDTKTSSNRPDMHGYRPFVHLLNAFDYSLGSGDTRPFHIHIFINYLFILTLFFFLLRKILSKTIDLNASTLNLISLIIVGFYGLHTANAETINYIISRSDLFSTLCGMLSLCLYQNNKLRRYFLYMIPLLVGYLTKQVMITFPFILFFYDYFFIQDDQKTIRSKFKLSFKSTLPALITVLLGFILSEVIMSDISNVVGTKSSGRLDYFLTQTHVIMHYLGNFIFPVDLSADPDLKIISNYTDSRILFGLSGNLILFGIGIYSAFQGKKLYPIAFGIFWFYLALAPTSSLMPLGQISNDHRTFYPFIGLVISSGYALLLGYQKLRENQFIKFSFIGLTIVVLLLHSYGTFQRCEVWDNEESLWLDAATKSPNNSRALMNYGLTQMEKGKYEIARDYFYTAVAIDPYYSSLHINLGVLENALGNKKMAEDHYKKAIRYLPNNPSGYKFYSRWLKKQNRIEESVNNLQKAYDLSPNYLGLKKELQKLIELSNNKGEMKKISGKNIFEQARICYAAGDHKQAIELFLKSIELAPNNALSYNNICASYCHLKKWDKAIEFCNKSIKIDSNLQIAKNNLNWAKSGLNE